MEVATIFCSRCGERLSGRFCARCGADAGVSFSVGASPSAADSAPEPVVCALTYALGALTGVLFLMLEPHNRNPRVRFHAMQSIFVTVAELLVWLALLLVSAVISIVPLLGALVAALLLGCFGLAALVLWVVLMLKAYQGEMWKIPVLGDWAEEQARKV